MQRMPCCTAPGSEAAADPADVSVPRMPANLKRKESNAHLIRAIPCRRPTLRITTPVVHPEEVCSVSFGREEGIAICGRHGPACLLYAYPGRRNADFWWPSSRARAYFFLPSSTSFVTICDYWICRVGGGRGYWSSSSRSSALKSQNSSPVN